MFDGKYEMSTLTADVVVKKKFYIQLATVWTTCHTLRKSMQKTYQFTTQCKGDISHTFKTAKITVFDPMM